jgi:RNA polymerase sigma factor (sigma-70 family)
MTALSDRDGVAASDAELAVAAAGGDRQAFADIYDRYADRLHDFCISMTRNRDAAADCVQNVFCIAATRLHQLREPDKLRPWLYAVARTETLRWGRQQARERATDDMPDLPSDHPDPETLAARTELADLVAEAAGGLSDRDRAVLELSYRHGLDGHELAEALNVSHSNAKKMAERLRDNIERSLGALLVARRVRSDPAACPALSAILDGWDGTLTVLLRKRIARHIDECPVCDDERSRRVNPVALLGATPVFIPAPHWLRAHTLGQIELRTASAHTGTDDTAASRATDSEQAPAAAATSKHRRALAVSAALLALIGAGAAVVIATGWLTHVNPSVRPALQSTPPATTTVPAPNTASPDVTTTSLAAPSPAAPPTAPAPDTNPTRATPIPTTVTSAQNSATPTSTVAVVAPTVTFSAPPPPRSVAPLPPVLTSPAPSSKAPAPTGFKPVPRPVQSVPRAPVTTTVAPVLQ